MLLESNGWVINEFGDLYKLLLFFFFFEKMIYITSNWIKPGIDVEP